MELKEAIEHAEQKAQDLNCDCREDHGQLAQWLRELQIRRETERNAIVVLQPLSPALGIVRAILDDNGLENVSSKVVGMQGSIDLVTAHLKGIKSEG